MEWRLEVDWQLGGDSNGGESKFLWIDFLGDSSFPGSSVCHDLLRSATSLKPSKDTPLRTLWIGRHRHMWKTQLSRLKSQWQQNRGTEEELVDSPGFVETRDYGNVSGRLDRGQEGQGPVWAEPGSFPWRPPGRVEETSVERNHLTCWWRMQKNSKDIHHCGSREWQEIAL